MLTTLLCNYTMTQHIEKRTAHSLMCLGLYTMAFEVMIFIWKAAIYPFIKEKHPERINIFIKACKSANDTIKFCKPIFLMHDVLNDSDFKELNSIRKHRNCFTHSGFDKIWQIHFDDIEKDLLFIDEVARKVETWGRKYEIPKAYTPGEAIPFTLSPLFFTNFIRRYAGCCARDLLEYKNDK